MPTSLKNRQIQHPQSNQGCRKQKVLQEILNTVLDVKENEKCARMWQNKGRLALHKARLFLDSCCIAQ